MHIGEGDNHVPMHKTVCCVLCRRKEERLLKKMQESVGASRGPQSKDDVTSDLPLRHTCSDAPIGDSHQSVNQIDNNSLSRTYDTKNCASPHVDNAACKNASNGDNAIQNESNNNSDLATSNKMMTSSNKTMSGLQNSATRKRKEFDGNKLNDRKDYERDAKIQPHSNGVSKGPAKSKGQHSNDVRTVSNGTHTASTQPHTEVKLRERKNATYEEALPDSVRRLSGSYSKYVKAPDRQRHNTTSSTTTKAINTARDARSTGGMHGSGAAFGSNRDMNRLRSTESGLDDVSDDGLSRTSLYGSFRGRDPAGSLKTKDGSFRPRDVTGSLRLRDPTADLQPISDPFLRQRLQGTTNLNVKLTPKDQKMLSRLLARREQEQQMSHQRELSHRLWEEERQKAQVKKQMSRPVVQKLEFEKAPANDGKSPRPRADDEFETASQTAHPLGDNGLTLSGDDSLSPPGDDGLWQLDEEGQARREQQLTVAERRRMTASCDLASNDQAVMSSAHPRLDRHHSEQGCNGNDDSVDSSCDPSHSSQKKSKKQLQVALDRKKAVEHNLQEQRQKTDKYLARIIEKQKQDTERVNAAKQDKKLNLAQKLKLRSLSVSEKQQKNADSTHYIGNDNNNASSTGSDLKSHTFTKEQSKAQADLQSKLEKSRLKQLEMEEELKDWQRQIILYRKMQDKQAVALATARMVEKREAAIKEREEKERLQRKNKMKMQAQEDEWKATVKAAIISKDARSRMVQMEKDAAIKKSREMANVTRRMRDELRLNTSMNDLDQLSKHVELENRMHLQSPP
jgi:hypothetical protein